MQLALFFVLQFIPVWAFFLWRFKLNGVHHFLWVNLSLVAFAVFYSFNPVWFPAVTNYLQYYALFLVVYLVMFTYKFGFERFNKALSLGVWMVYLASEIWEIPIFIPFILSKLQLVWFLKPLYLTLSFNLLLKTTYFKFTRKSFTLLLLIPVFSWVCLRFGFNSLARVVGLGLTGLVAWWSL